MEPEQVVVAKILFTLEPGISRTLRPPLYPLWASAFKYTNPALSKLNWTKHLLLH